MFSSGRFLQSKVFTRVLITLPLGRDNQLAYALIQFGFFVFQLLTPVQIPVQSHKVARTLGRNGKMIYISPSSLVSFFLIGDLRSNQ